MFRTRFCPSSGV